ncbi:LexA family transcriptional regulator [Cupriavidus necator]|uniref:Peptidase S24, S26A and S26B n=1 Tax=Cupriavidus pinatubonensis (strain JMP 134 / LMG 1197) TaxID=264198 RepID=Q46YP1_CUPPJ|nr:XRE family transcriptional regulator [Cupriavidus necator]
MEIKDIRRNNLLALLSGFASIRAFADRTGVPAAYISQIKNEAGGRGMGNKTARTIEEALSLPNGYMDQAHAEAGVVVHKPPSPATTGRPAAVVGTIEKWQIEDANRLKQLFESKAPYGQDEFGRRFEIGTQGMVWQYLNARRALNINAASAFARGLGIAVDDFSPRLAEEIRLAESHIADAIPPLPQGAEAGVRPSDRIALVMAEQHLDVQQLAQLLAVEPAVVRAWLEPDSPKLGLLHAVRLQDAYGYSPKWLINGQGEPKLGGAIEPELDEPSLAFDVFPIPQNSFRKIPVRGMAQLGDNGHFVDIEYPVGHGDGYVFFPTKDPDAYALRCNGESMRPRVKHNEFVVVEPNTQIQNGDEVLAKSQDGRVMVKELAYIRDGIVHLSSVNERHGMVRIPQDQIERLHFVAGIVKRSAWQPD